MRSEVKKYNLSDIYEEENARKSCKCCKCGKKLSGSVWVKYIDGWVFGIYCTKKHAQ